MAEVARCAVIAVNAGSVTQRFDVSCGLLDMCHARAFGRFETAVYPLHHGVIPFKADCLGWCRRELRSVGCHIVGGSGCGFCRFAYFTCQSLPSSLSIWRRIHSAGLRSPVRYSLMVLYGTPQLTTTLRMLAHSCYSSSS